MNNKRLNFYTIKDGYIKYIGNFDSHIAYNKVESRPYVGVILNLNNISYFAPMFSPKLQHLKYKENFTYFKMYGNSNKKDYLGLIRFSDMIPVPEFEISLVDFTEKDRQYNMLLNKQYKYINQTLNRNIIREKAINLYNIVVSNNRDKTTIFYKKLCCNLKLLEQKCLEYKNYITN